MYIHLGSDVAVLIRDIIGIFDIEKTGTKKATRDFLKLAEKQGLVTSITDETPKTYIVVKDAECKHKIYLSPISVATLNKRQKGIC